MATPTPNDYSLDGLRRRGDKIMSGVLWAHLLFAFGLAGWYDTWGEAMAIGLPAALVPTILAFVLPGALITRIAVGAGFMIFSALVIHQAHGMIEMHFGIFVLLAFLLYYRDWLPILAAAAVIAVHHLTFNFLQADGVGVYVFPERTGLDLVIIHAVYVVVESAFLIYAAITLNKETVLSEEIHEIGSHLRVEGEQIDLTFRKEGATSGFATGFNGFMDGVHGVIGNSRSSAERLIGLTDRLNEVTQTSASGMAQQQSSVHQVVTAIDQMNTAIHEVAGNANIAAEASGKADHDASEGATVVNRATQAIESLAREVANAAEVIQQLEQESNNIGGVLDVIKGIAEQTNLLALNAAIEAARAGEQGRGFAVVADEVRTLASRTQESTAEIQGMIERLQSGAQSAVEAMGRSQSEAQSGVEQATQVGGALNSIAEAVGQINDMNNQIASAAEEQSAMAEEVKRNIATIQEVSESAASGIGEAAGASGELAQLADGLEEMVRRFRI